MNPVIPPVLKMIYDLGVLFGDSTYLVFPEALCSRRATCLLDMFGNGDRMFLGWKHMQTIWKHQMNKFKKQLHHQSSCCTERSVIWTPGLFNSGVRFWQQHITTIGVDRWLCWPFIILHLWNMLEFLESMTNQNWLVVSTPLKIWKSIGMIIPNIWKNKNCSRPPTRELLETTEFSTQWPLLRPSLGMRRLHLPAGGFLWLELPRQPGKRSLVSRQAIGGFKSWVNGVLPFFGGLNMVEKKTSSKALTKWRLRVD